MDKRQWLPADPAYLKHCQNNTAEAGVIRKALVTGDECTLGSQCPFYHHNLHGEGQERDLQPIYVRVLPEPKQPRGLRFHARGARNRRVEDDEKPAVR